MQPFNTNELNHLVLDKIIVSTKLGNLGAVSAHVLTYNILKRDFTQFLNRSSQGFPDWTCIVAGFTSGYIRFYLQVIQPATYIL